MTGTFRWHSCSTSDFPLKRHKVSKACEVCRAKKMRCDGKNPCQRCESNKATCTYSDKPTRPRSKSNRHQVMLDKLQFLDDHYRTKNYRTSCPLLFLDIFHIPTYSIDITSIAFEHKLDSVLHDPWVKDAVQQFVTHHLLYGPWIDVQSSLLVYSVLAIMLYPLDENYARLFYREAHRHFIDSCFPMLEQKKQDQHLIEAAVLLTHFQCMAISEEQAFMTIRLGLDLAQSKGNLNGALLRTLDAWYIWLTVHLRRPYFGEIDASMKLTGLNDNQLWAFEMTEAYTDFLKRIILERRSTDLKLIQVKLKSNKVIREPISLLGFT
ncbi:hypothetical protein RMCBS344292_17102 [Rhizopus microsporus]|nr:hypothetical protein RMCBS344292_17102 [Rhizopus microsporus]